MPLPERPAGPFAVGSGPIADESLISFMFRLARRRRRPAAWAIAAECGFEWWTNRPRPEWLAKLAEVSGADLAALEALTYGPPDNTRVAHFRGRALHPSVFRKRGWADRRICPDCLAESPHHRAIWDPLFISTCPVHLKVLVDACDECGEPFQWKGVSLTWCKCKRGRGRDLTRIPGQRVAPEDAEATMAVYGLLGDERFAAAAERVRALKPFADLEDGQIVDFLFRLGLEVLGPRGKVFSLDKLGETAWQSHIALKLGLAAVNPWPGAFHAVLEEMCRRSANYPAGQWKWLGPVERWLTAIPSERGLAVRAAVAEYKVVE